MLNRVFNLENLKFNFRRVEIRKKDFEEEKKTEKEKITPHIDLDNVKKSFTVTSL